MANNNMDKYVKKHSERRRNIAQKSGSWIANAFKSVGYSTFDVLQELLPSTIDAAKVTASTGKDIAEKIKQSRTSDRTLRQAIDRNYYVGLGRDVFKNSLEDLKSGKFYNKERADQFFADMNNDMMDFGDFEDFDVGEDGDDFSSSVDSMDGETNAQFKRKKSGNTDVTSVVVNTNLGPDSAMYQATEYQTETMVNVGRAITDINKTNSRALMMTLGGMRNEINANLTSINDNVSQISTVIGESVSKASVLAAKYYEDSINLQTQILEQLKLQAPNTQINTRTFRDYDDVQSLFSSGGMLDPKAYAGLVKKQLNSYIDNSLFLSPLKSMMNEKETLKMMAQNPLAFVPKAITKQLIPATVKSVLSEFDNQFKETGLAALNQISGLQRSGNPILAALGKIFGVQNKITISSIDKGAYNKGATAWTGTDHQALVNVIPTLLRKIHATVSGSEEIAFNYETGQFQKVRDMEKQFEKDKLQRETSGFSDYKADFKEFMEQNLAISREEREKFSDDFDKFISALVRDPHGGRTFRKGGRSGKFEENNIDDIRDLLHKSSSEDDSVRIIRAFLQGMEDNNNAALTRFFGSAVQEQRARLDQTMREMQADPTKYNTMYMNTGLGEHNRKGKATRGGINTDAHLAYHKDDLTKVDGVVGGILGKDKFGRSQTDYLRDILKTLNTGIYVVPIGQLDGASGEGSQRLTAINNRLASQQSLASREETSYQNSLPKPNRDRYTGSDRQQRDVEEGKLANLSEDDIESAAKIYHRTMRDEERSKGKQGGLISKLLGMLPEDSGAGRMLNRVRSAQDKFSDKTTEVIHKLDNAMFQIVFGNEKGHKGFHALFDKTLESMKAGFSKFGLFIDNKVLKPLDEALFGENGVINKVKQTDAWKKISEFTETITKKAGTFFLGEKDAEGKRSGGIFSETANSLKDIGTHVKESILGKKGPDGKPIPLEDDNSVLGNLKRVFKNTTESIGKHLGIDTDSKETFGTKLANGMDMIYARIKERAGTFTDNLFGSSDGGPEFLKQFKEDMKGNGGFVGASAAIGGVGGLVLGGHMGLIGSMFLPGGPIGGAILGAGIGIATKSTGLQNFLFGPEVDGERQGGLITKDFQEFFKNNKTGITAGGFAGLAASFGLIPSMFVPGGPIGGALIGGALSMASKTEAFQTLMYGEGGTKDDPTGGISKKLKELFGKNKDLKGLGMDAGIGAGVGVLGSFFLPGGPIIGGLLGSVASVGLASEKFKNWFFGEEKDGKREGGIFGKFSGWMKEKVFSKMATAAQIAQTKILGFVKENMVLPFQFALKPLTEEAKYLGGVIKEKITGVFDNIKDKFHQHVTKPIGDAVEEYILGPMKKMLKKVFGGLGRLIGHIITSPFRLLTGGAKLAYERQKGRGVKGYKEGVEEEYQTKVSELMKTNDPNKGFFGNLFAKGKGWVGLLKERSNKLHDKDALKAAQFGENGASYDPNGDYWQQLEAAQAQTHAETEAKVAALRNGTKIDTSSIAAGGGASGTTTESGSGETTVVNTSTPIDYTEKKNEIRARLEAARRRRAEKAAKAQGTQVDTSSSSGESGSFETAINDYIDSLDQSTSQPTRVAVSSGSSDTSVEQREEKKRSWFGSFFDKIQEKLSAITDYLGTIADDFKARKSNSTHVDSSVPSSASSDIKPPKPEEPDKTKVVSDSSGGSGKESGSLLQRIQKDVSNIADSVYGQLNGVGKNVNKIYRMLLKTHKMNDDDIEGDDNKEYVGFFGKLRTALNRPLTAIRDLITAPFRKLSELGHGFVEKMKGLGGALKKGASAIKDGIVSVVSGIGSVAVEVAKLPFEIIRTGLSAVRAILPALGEAASGVVSLAVDGIKVAGSLVVTGVETIGNTIAGAASGFGKLLGGAMSGLGSLLSSVGLIGKDLVAGAWKGIKAVGSGAASAIGAVVSAPFSLLKNRKGGGLFGNKGPIHVIVDSGTLDRVKTVKHVRDVKLNEGLPAGGKGGFGNLKPIQKVKPLPGGFGKIDETKKVVHVVIDDLKKTAIEKLGGKVQAIAGKAKGFLGIDRNVGDTAVDSSISGGGSADDAAGSDQSLADDDNRTSVATSIANLKNSFAEAGKQMSDGFAAIKENFSTKIAARQAQVDKGSRASMMERFASAKKAAEESKFRSKLLSLVGQNTQTAKEHKSIFSSIFSKKGLITAAIIAFLPQILKIVPTLINFIKGFKLDELFLNLAKSIKQGFDEIGGLIGLLNNAKEKKDQANAVITGEKDLYEIDEDGHLVYDENGKPKKKTEKINRLEELFMPKKTRINTDTGKFENKTEWTQMSGATGNLLTHKVGLPFYKTAKKGVNAVKATKKVLKYAAGKISNTDAFTTAYVYADDAMKAAKTKVANTAGGKFVKKTITNAKGGAKKLATDLVTKAKGSAGKVVDKVTHSGIVEKFIEKAGEVFNFLAGKLAGVGKKLGINVADNSILKFIKGLTTKIMNAGFLKKFAPKIAKFMSNITSKTAASGATAFLAEIGFATYGALDGMINAAWVFEVSKDAVDEKMKMIAAVFKGLLNTTAGCVLDFVNALLYDIMGTNFLKDIATHVYKLLSDEEDQKSIEAAQDDFTKEYHDYVEKEYEAYKKNTEEQGQQAMSLDDFKASDLSTSRSEFNSKKNKSLFKRVVDKVQDIKNLPKNIKEGATSVWKTVTGGPKAWMKGIQSLSGKALDGAKAAGNFVVDRVTAPVRYAKLLATGAKNALGFIGDKIGETEFGQTVKNSAFGKAVGAAGSFVGGAINKVGGVINGAKDAVGGVIGNVKDTIVDTVKGAADWVGDKVDAVGTAVMNVGRGGNDGGRPISGGKGGDEPEMLNGMPYYSQNDPRYKNIPYHLTGGKGNDTIGDAGCGPTAMAMVASKVTGKDYNPVTMTRMAEAGGYGTRVGTTPGYFSAAGNALGIPNAQQQPSKGNLEQSLANGNSVILQGAKGAGGGSANSPYTSEGHYVTATGVDKDKVYINDPRGKEFSGAYRMGDVMKDTTGMWSFASGRVGGGKGETRVHQLVSTFIPDRHRSHSSRRLAKGGKGGNSFTAADVINVAKNEIGYEEKASASNLEDPHANKGRSNHTKYEKEVFGSSGNYWCASFVSWCFMKAANGDKDKAKQVLGALSMSCEVIRGALRSAGRLDKTAKVGDAIFFKGSRHAGANHIGIVAEINGNKITTIEGNTSSHDFNDNGGTVASHTYDINYAKILDFGHPNYDGSSNFQGVTATAGATSSEAAQTPDGATTSASNSSSGSGFSELFSGLADAIVSPLSRAFGLSSDNSQSGTTTDTTATSTDGTATTDGTSVTTTGNGSFPTYQLNDAQIKGVANILQHEQPGLSGMMAEASLMANLTDKMGDDKATVENLVKKATGGWFAHGKDRFNNPGNPSADAIKAAREVLIGGKRTVPRYIDEHDCFSDLTSATNNGKAINVRNRSEYQPNVTKVKNRYGSAWTFYTFPNDKADPFGYTSDSLRSKWGDAHFDVNSGGNGGKNGGRPLPGGKGDTIGNAGCGPTAMAMVASKVTGKDYNPATMAHMAESGGYATQVGTTPGYFSAAGNALGIPNAQVEPSKGNLQQSLANGDSVILQGARGGFGNSPYTSEGHYVTATGIDNDKVYINDPRGKEYSGAYRLNDVMQDTTGMWSFGAGGYGKGKDKGKGKGQTSVDSIHSTVTLPSNGRTDKVSSKRNAAKNLDSIHSTVTLPTNGRLTNTTSDTKKKKKKKKGQLESGETTSSTEQMSDYEKWIGIVRAVKQAIAAQHPGYSQKRSITITVGGRSMRARTDCSGYVQTCLKYFGVLSESANLTSSNVANAGDGTMKSTGFTPMAWPGWENLKEGDIMGRSGHTEIFAYNKDGAHYVYNCGSDSSTNNPNPVRTAKSSYTTIWRCGAAGSGAVSDVGVGGVTSALGSVSTAAASGSSGNGFLDAFTGFSDALLAPVFKAFGLNPDGSSNGTAVTSGDSGVFAATNLAGGDNAQKVWNYFTNAGYSKAATAGILGNMEQESGVNPSLIQGNGRGPAAGIVQWENYNTKSSRWKAMSDYAKSQGKDWTDLGAQLEFIDREMKDPGTTYWTKPKGMANAGTTTTTYDAWKNSTDVETATRQFEGAFERAGKPMMNKRLSAAKGYFEKFSNMSAEELQKDDSSTSVDTKDKKGKKGKKKKDKETSATTTVPSNGRTDKVSGKRNAVKANTQGIHAIYTIPSGGKGGSKGGSPIQRVDKPHANRVSNRGFGNVSSSSRALSDQLSSAQRSAIMKDKSIASFGSGDLSQLLKVAVNYLSQIADNTGETTTELDTLNKKDFGTKIVSQNNTTNNNVVNDSKKSKSDKGFGNVADRSEYAMAKRVAAGILD